MRERRILRKIPRYVLALNYSERLHTVVDSLFSLSALAGEWKAKVVMPFTVDSKVVGLPRPDGSAAPLEFLLDKQHLDNLSCSYNLPPFAAFQDLLQSAARKAILIHFVYEMENDADTKLIADKIGQSPIVDCSEFVHLQRTATAIVTTLERETSKAFVSGFNVTKVVCVNASHSTSLRELVAKSGLMDFSVVLVTDWRGVSTASDKREWRGQRSAIQQEVPGASLGNYTIPYSIRYLRPSHCVSDTTNHFRKTAVSSGPFVAIHFHSERLGQRDRQMPGYFKNCFARAMQLRNDILGRDSSLPVYYFADCSSYSSQLCVYSRGAVLLDAAIVLHVSNRSCYNTLLFVL